jgi:hypothetical protein
MSTYVPWISRSRHRLREPWTVAPSPRRPKRMVRSGHSRDQPKYASRVTSRDVIGTQCSIQYRHECVKVNANKSLYGNERETSSTRSTGFRHPGSLPFLSAPGYGDAREHSRLNGPMHLAGHLKSRKDTLEHSAPAGSGTNVPSHGAEGPARITQPRPEPNTGGERLTGDG